VACLEVLQDLTYIVQTRYLTKARRGRRQQNLNFAMARHEEEIFAALTRLAFAGDGLVFGFGMTVLAVRTWVKFWSHSKALKDIRETPLTRIADIRTLAEESDGQLREEIKIPEKVNFTHCSSMLLV